LSRADRPQQFEIQEVRVSVFLSRRHHYLDPADFALADFLAMQARVSHEKKFK
jgi:hypothetical protein